MEVTTTRTSTTLTADWSISRTPASFLHWNATIAVPYAILLSLSDG
jgi:hypothetical protein